MSQPLIVIIDRIIIWHEKVSYDGHAVSMAIQVVCGVNEQGAREALAIEPMLEESRENYTQLFDKLKKRGFQTPPLVIGCCRAQQRFSGHFSRSYLFQGRDFRYTTSYYMI